MTAAPVTQAAEGRLYGGAAAGQDDAVSDDVDLHAALAEAQAGLEEAEAELKRLAALFGSLLNDVRNTVVRKLRARDTVIAQQAQLIRAMGGTLAQGRVRPGRKGKG